MALDFEKFLNEALDDTSEKKDILDLTSSPDELEDDELTEFIEPIRVDSIISQIQNLKSQSTHSPQAFKEVYEKLEEFEKLFPQYLIQIQSTFFDTQTQLKESYLTKIQETQDLKIKKLTQFLTNQCNQISAEITNNNFESAHIYLQNLNIELSKIPKSHTILKYSFLEKYTQLLTSYYDYLSKNKEELDLDYSNKIIKIISQKKVFLSTNRVEIDKMLDDIQKLLSQKKIELDINLSKMILVLNEFYVKLLLHRNKIELKFTQEFEQIFEQLMKQFKTYISQKNLGKSLLILEMGHILLKKESKYNQDLKLNYFLKILNQKKELNKLSVDLKKTLTQDEVMYTFYYAKVQVIDILKHKLGKYSEEEIKHIETEISLSDFISSQKKKVLLDKIDILKRKNIDEFDFSKKEHMSKKKTQKTIHTKKDSLEIKEKIHKNISQLHKEFIEEKDENKRNRKKGVLLAYIKKYVKKELQEALILKVSQENTNLGGN